MGWGSCLGNHPLFPVSFCQGEHQRPCAFCLSTRLWMKELARAQFQLFIACKPERWREREGMRREWVCTWVCAHAHAMLLIISALFFFLCVCVLSHSCGSSDQLSCPPPSLSLFLSFSTYNLLPMRIPNLLPEILPASQSSHMLWMSNEGRKMI